MIDRLRQLERDAKPLEPDAATRATLAAAATAYADEFIESIASAPAYQPPGAPAGDLTWGEQGIDVGDVLRELREVVDSPGINPTSDRFLGFIPGGAVYHSALGDFLAAIANRYAGYNFASPGAVRMENQLLRWMADLIGYPSTALGNLTSGGSLAHLTGITTARDAMEVDATSIPRTVVYLTEQAHHCVDKGLHVAGLRECIRREVPTDDAFRMSADGLHSAIEADKRAGLRPWLVISSAGTVNTGAIDPLPEIGQIADRHGLWSHVDGAYGAFFALCPPGRQRLAGMDLSHSLVMDPHKTLFLPYGTGALLIRDGDNLLRSFSSSADYMQDGRDHDDDVSPADVSVELTKHFRGLRMWLPLKLVGVAPFRAALEEKLLLAEYFHNRILETPGFSAGPAPELAVATFWYEPPHGDANAFNQRLLKELQMDGRVFLTSTMLRDRFVIRVAVGVYRTHLAAIDEALELIRHKATTLVNNLSR